MANTSLFDVIEDAAATSPTLAPPEPKEPEEPESLFDGVALTDFDAEGNPMDPYSPDAPKSLGDKYAEQRELDEDDEAEYAATCGEAGPEVPEDPDPYHGEDIPDEICACMMVDDWAEQEDEIEPDETQALAETPADAPLETEHRAALECSHDGDTYVIVAEHVNGRWEVAAQDGYGKEYTRKIYHYARANEWLPEAAAAQGVNVKRSGVRDFQTTPEFGRILARAVVERIKKYGWGFISHKRLDLVITPI